MLRRAIVVACVLLAAFPAAAGRFSLDWSSSAARAGAGWNAAGGLLKLEAGWLHDEDLGAAARFGVLVEGDVMPNARRQLRGGLGGRAYWIDVDLDDGVGVGVGGFLSWRLMQGRTRLEIEAYTAPESLCGDGIEGITELGGRVAFEVVPRAELYFGWRTVDVELELGPDVDLDGRAHVGIRLLF